MTPTPHARPAEPGADQWVGGSEAGLSPALREELLDPPAWREGLGQYAQAMHLAVALTGPDGRLLGPCLNPRPLWRLLRARVPAGAGQCPFALAPLKPCTCVSDGFRNAAVVRVRDRTGLVHFAVPLLLGGERLGALVAGQVFDQYPEQLALDHFATKFGLSPAKVWGRARLEPLVGPSLLRVYEDLLATLGRTFLLSRYHALLESSRLARLRRAEEALRKANDELERRVQERTAELEEAQNKVVQAERLAAVGQMVAGLAHESRNAMQRAQACVERLRLRLQGQAEALDLLARLDATQDDLYHLYEDVREYAAPIRLNRCACDLSQVWREAWADLAPHGNGREVHLREELGGVDLRCVADAFRMKQVFRNLLDNALAAGAQHLVVHCAGVESGGRPAIQIAVRDDGPGFTAEQRGKLFEPFHTTKTHGTGLGLAICKRIVEAHEGRIVAGAGPAPGAEVVVTLPRGGGT